MLYTCPCLGITDLDGWLKSARFGTSAVVLLVWTLGPGVSRQKASLCVLSPGARMLITGRLYRHAHASCSVSETARLCICRHGTADRLKVIITLFTEIGQWAEPCCGVAQRTQHFLDTDCNRSWERYDDVEHWESCYRRYRLSVLPLQSGVCLLL